MWRHDRERRGFTAQAINLRDRGACTSDLIWCRRRDLNPHGLRHTPLKRACLPFHHFGTQQDVETNLPLRSRIAQTLNVLSSTPRAFARCGLVAGLFDHPAFRPRVSDEGIKSAHYRSRAKFLSMKEPSGRIGSPQLKCPRAGCCTSPVLA